MSSVRERIMAALRGSGRRPMSVNAVARRLGYDHAPGHMAEAVDELVAAGKVEKCGGCEHCGAGARYVSKDAKE
jgi:methionine synthase I (cobalamin-dependent)